MSTVLPPRSLICIAALVVLATLAHAATAEGRLAVYAPKAASSKRAAFRVAGVPAASVRGATLRVGRSHRSLPLRRVRAGVRRGRVVVRLGSARHPRRIRLMLRLRAARDAARKPAAPQGKPAPEPVPAPVPSDPVPSDPVSPDPVSPDPAPADCLTAGTAFRAGNWPGDCWRPFAPASPFNRPIPDGARLVSNSSAIVRRMVSLYRGPGKMSAGDADTVDDYLHPLYYPTASDPVFTLHCYETSWGTCPIEGHRIRIPDAARPAGGSDAHLAVIDHASGWEYDLYKVRSKPSGGGVLEFRWGGRTRLDGDGLGSNATAAHFALSAGIIRPEELAAGRIDHALFMVVKCTAGMVYPAGGGGAQCADPADAPAGGMRFQLDYTSAEIEALAVPRWKKTIFHALATYGAYVGDTGGTGFNFQFQSGSTYTSFGHEDRLVDWAQTQPGVTPYNGKYVFDVGPGVDWSRLRVIDPCVTSGTC